VFRPSTRTCRPRAQAGGVGREARYAAGKGPQGSQDRQGAAFARHTHWGGESHLGDFIEDTNAILPPDAAIQSELRETTTRVLASLTAREERILRMRFGIGMNKDHTLEEVGQQFWVTRERIRKIEAKALRKLKHPSRSQVLRSFLDR
jgi:RNA polymerase sigma factor (sigma-70 family)